MTAITAAATTTSVTSSTDSVYYTVLYRRRNSRRRRPWMASLIKLLPVLAASASPDQYKQQARHTSTSGMPMSRGQEQHRHHVKGPSSFLIPCIRGGDSSEDDSVQMRDDDDDNNDGNQVGRFANMGTYDDETLDAYVDFLLAYAEGEASEEDNPLLGDFPILSSSSSDDEIVSGVGVDVIEAIEVDSTNQTSSNAPPAEEEEENNDEEVEEEEEENNQEEEEEHGMVGDPLLGGDVENTDHLDRMVDTLVSSIESNPSVEDNDVPDNEEETYDNDNDVTIENEVLGHDQDENENDSGLNVKEIENDQISTETEVIESERFTDNTKINDDCQIEMMETLEDDRVEHSSPESLTANAEPEESERLEFETVEAAVKDGAGISDDQIQPEGRKEVPLWATIMENLKTKMNNDGPPADGAIDAADDLDVTETTTKSNSSFGWPPLFAHLSYFWRENELKDDIHDESDAKKLDDTYQLELDDQTMKRELDVNDGDPPKPYLPMTVKQYYSDALSTAQNTYRNAWDTMSAFLATNRSSSHDTNDLSLPNSSFSTDNQPFMEDYLRIYNKYFTKRSENPVDGIDVDIKECEEHSKCSTKSKTGGGLDILRKPWGVLTEFLREERKNPDNSRTSALEKDRNTDSSFVAKVNSELETAQKAEDLDNCEETRDQKSNITIFEESGRGNDDSETTFVFDLRAEVESSIDSDDEDAIAIKSSEEAPLEAKPDFDIPEHVRPETKEEDTIEELIVSDESGNDDESQAKAGDSDYAEDFLSSVGSLGTETETAEADQTNHDIVAIINDCDKEKDDEEEANNNSNDEDANPVSKGKEITIKKCEEFDFLPKTADSSEKENYEHDKEDELLDVVDEISDSFDPDVDVGDGIATDIIETLENEDHEHEKEDELLEFVEEVIDTVGPGSDVDDNLDFDESVQDEEEDEKSLIQHSDDPEEDFRSANTSTLVEEETSDIDDEEDEEANVEAKSEIQYKEVEDSLLDAPKKSVPAFVTRSADAILDFFLARKMEHWIMIAIVFFEWIRVFLLDPIVETCLWMKDGKTNKLFHATPSEWVRFRGGASDDNSVEEEAESAPDHSHERSADGNDDDHDEAPRINDVKPATADGTENRKSEDTPGHHKIEEDGPKDYPGSRRRVRPNRLYRILLNYGYPGHSVIMSMIVVAEWIEVYVPALPALANYIRYDLLKYRRYLEDGGSRDQELSHTSGFLSADGTAARGGRKRKAQTKKDDQRALGQLRKLGDVNQARYRLLSESFMKRHNLGPTARLSSKSKSMFVTRQSEKSLLANALEEVENDAESDLEWIVQALTVEEEDLDFEQDKSMFDTNVGVSLGSDAPTVTVGVSFSIGDNDARGKKKSKSKQKRSPSGLKTSSASLSISEAARKTYVSRRKSSGPRLSDSEGGMMGRLRAASANSLMGRNILGAYPGDLPSPQEAADASGLIVLARRYGYGEWSDDDDQDDDGDDYDSRTQDSDDNEDYDYPPESRDGRRMTVTKKVTSGSSTKKKKRRTRSSNSSNAVGIEFDLTSSSHSSPPSATASAVTTLRKKASSPASVVESSHSSTPRKSRKRLKGFTPGHSIAVKKDRDVSTDSAGKPVSSRGTSSRDSKNKDTTSSTTSRTSTKKSSRSIVFEKRTTLPPPAMSILKDVHEKQKSRQQDHDGSASTK